MKARTVLRYRGAGRRGQRKGWATEGIVGGKVRQWDVRLREGKVTGWTGSGRVKQRILITNCIFLTPSGHWGKTSLEATRLPMAKHDGYLW